VAVGTESFRDPTVAARIALELARGVPAGEPIGAARENSAA
jgi:hypothetical protein